MRLLHLTGVLAGRPLVGCIAAWLGAGAVAFLALRQGVVPDPQAAGAAGTAALALIGLALAVTYMVASWLSGRETNEGAS